MSGMNTDELVFAGQLVQVTCWCGIRLAIPAELNNFRHREHDAGRSFTVHCPLGHGFVPAGKSRVERERERTQAAIAEAIHLHDQLAAANRAHAATKGQLTKTRKRAAAALCPVPGCCRSFVQLQRHLAVKHPEWHAP